MSDTNHAGHASEPALESTDDPRSTPWRLNSIIDELQQSGAERVRLVVEDESGTRYEHDDVVLLHVRAIYDHHGMEVRLRRYLDAVGDTVRWQGRELGFEYYVGPESDATEWRTVYDRFR